MALLFGNPIAPIAKSAAYPPQRVKYQWGLLKMG
jgi:hypothetical protein